MIQPDTITITLDRRLLEHPQALHLKRMRTTLFLYLALLRRLPAGAGTIEVRVATLADALGLKEGTVRSWLGHLKRGGYIDLKRLNGSVIARLPTPASPHLSTPVPDPLPAEADTFTVAAVQRSLGEASDPDALAAALAQHSPQLIQRALAGALAPAASEIRRSRTALFLYLLKRYGSHTTDHPRPGSGAA
jgi:hypothetical protein